MILRHVAEALSAKVRVILEPEDTAPSGRLAEAPVSYRVRRNPAKS